MPAIGYYYMGMKGLGDGYVLGTIVSLILWFTFGKKMIYA
jgi:hypothetical protein